MRIHKVKQVGSPVRRLSLRRPATGAVLALGSLALEVATQQAWAIDTPADLGTVGTYSVLGGQVVTSTAPSILSDGCQGPIREHKHAGRRGNPAGRPVSSPAPHPSWSQPPP